MPQTHAKIRILERTHVEILTNTSLRQWLKMGEALQAWMAVQTNIKIESSQVKVMPTGVVYYWEDHFDKNKWKNAGQQLERFKKAVDAFKNRGWVVPDDIPGYYITDLINRKQWWMP